MLAILSYFTTNQLIKLILDFKKRAFYEVTASLFVLFLELINDKLYNSLPFDMSELFQMINEEEFPSETYL